MDEETTDSSISESQELIDPRDNIKQFFTGKEIGYYKIVINYFSKEQQKENIKKMISIINKDKESKISLRLLDWFVTKYTKTEDIPEEFKLTMMRMKIKYNACLNSYKKRYFDAFRRYKRFLHFINDEFGYVETTIGQLNFFMWVFENDIMTIIENNYDFFIQEMIEYNKREKEKKKEKKKSKTVKKETVVVEKQTTKNQVVDRIYISFK